MKRMLRNRVANIRVAVVVEPLVKEGYDTELLQILLVAFPKAEVFTAFLDSKYVEKHLPHTKINTSFLQYFPQNGKLRHISLLFQSVAYGRFKFKDFDIVISVSSDFARFVNARGIPHLNICKSVSNKIWEREGRLKKSKQLLYSMYVSFVNSFFERNWQKKDSEAAQQCTKVIALSNVVKKHISTVYKIDAEIIAPPANMKFLKSLPKMNRKENWILYWGTMQNRKDVEFVIKAAVKSETPLKVVGQREDWTPLQSLVQKLNAKGFVKFLSNVSKEEKYDLISRAKALVYINRADEIGVLPVEANALGTPVLAMKAGAVVETISETNPKTGFLFEKTNVDDFAKMLKKLKPTDFDPDNCRKQANNFAPEIFIYKLQNYVKDVLQKN